MLEAVPNAVVMALDILAINLNGNFFVIRPKMRGRTTKPCTASPGNGFSSVKISHNVTILVTRQYCGKVVSKARYHRREVRRTKDLTGYKEEDSDWCEIDYPGGDLHHCFRQGGKEIEKRFAFLSKLGQGYAKNYCEDNKAESVSSVGLFLSELPSKWVRDVAQIPSFLINAGWSAVGGWLNKGCTSMLHGGLHKVGRCDLPDLSLIHI